MIAADSGGCLVVVGRNSNVWRRIEAEAPPGVRVRAISHREIEAHRFGPDDRVWILSYSRHPADNTQLFEALLAAGARHCFYVSTATANVAAFTSCYSYPRAKLSAEQDAQRILGARIVRIGLVHSQADELPAGINAVTSLAMFSNALANPPEGDRINLFTHVTTPFDSMLERRLFRLYGHLIRLAGTWPCLLRPLDQLLKMLGMRWYGYVYLSNQLWRSSRSPAPEIIDHRG